MRFLHTADLHLGRKLGDLSLLEDQKHLLQQILEIAIDKKVDGVLIAGDIYNKSSPSSDAMMVFDSFISKLAQAGIKVFMISGNHDSEKRIAYFSSLIRNAGVHTCEQFSGVLQKVTLEDAQGVLNIYLMPFIRPVEIRKIYPEETITTFAEAVRAVISNSSIDTAERNVLVCHQFVTGGELSDSEDFAVGTLDSVDADLFSDFDYVALGHLHKAQKVSRETLRYAGSIMKYSLSEMHHRKSVVLIDINEKQQMPQIQKVPLNALRDVREIRGTLEEIMEMEYSEDYVAVILSDEFVPPDARVSIATVFPNMIRLAVQNSRSREEADVVETENIETKSKMQLFGDFYCMQSGGTAPDPAQIKIMEEILQGLEELHYEAD